MHIIFAGCKYDTDLDNPKQSWTSMLDGFLCNWAIGNNCDFIDSLMRTHIYMYRDLLISKEKMEQFCMGKCYRQFHHKTPKEEEFYEESINDDVNSFFEDIKLGRKPTVDLKWTYFLPELTSKELELVANKDEEYFKRFKWSSNPDVDEAEMKASKSSSKYVCAYCCRETLVFSDWIDLRQEKESLRQWKECLRREKEYSRQWKECLRQEKECLRQWKECLRREKEYSGQEKESLRQEKERLRQWEESLRQEKERLRQWKECLRQEKESLQQTNEFLQQYNESLQQADEFLQQGNESLQLDNEFLQQDNESLRREKEYSRQENESLRREKESLRQEKESLRQNNESLRQENARLRRRNQALQEEIESSFFGRIRRFFGD